MVSRVFVAVASCIIVGEASLLRGGSGTPAVGAVKWQDGNIYVYNEHGGYAGWGRPCQNGFTDHKNAPDTLCQQAGLSFGTFSLESASRDEKLWYLPQSGFPIKDEYQQTWCDSRRTNVAVRIQCGEHDELSCKAANMIWGHSSKYAIDSAEGLANMKCWSIVDWEAEWPKICQSWCQNNNNPWVTKCGWEVNTCAGCPQCNDLVSGRKGCLEPKASNYDPTATIADSCTFCDSWCTDTSFRNPVPWSTKCGWSACKSCHKCTYTKYGCMDAEASNYDEDATHADGSCDRSHLSCEWWCEKNDQPLQRKCGWTACGGCSQC